MRVPGVKQKKIAAEDVLLLSLPPDVGNHWSVCVCVCVFIKLHITAQSGLVVCVCVCVCVFIKLHITTQSGPVILVILCHSH